MSASLATPPLPKAESALAAHTGQLGKPGLNADGDRRLKVVFVGHVDHGKSTLIGRIFYDTKSLPEGKVEQIQAACKEEGMEFEYAFLLDALLEEQ